MSSTSQEQERNLELELELLQERNKKLATMYQMMSNNQTLISAFKWKDDYIGFGQAINHITFEEIGKLIKSSHTLQSQRRLRMISRLFYYASPHYRSLINYNASLYTFDYVVEPYGVKDFNKVNKEKYLADYRARIAHSEEKNIRKFGQEIMRHCMIDGVFFGFARREGGFSIQRFSPDLCRISFIHPDTGMLGYAFNFGIFANNPDLLDNYPLYFREVYDELIANKKAFGWVNIAHPAAVCITPHSQENPIPPLCGLFEDIIDLTEYKDLAKLKEELDNYKLITQEIPLQVGNAQKDELNAFALDKEFTQYFHNLVQDELPDGVGLATTPMKLDMLEVAKKDNQRDTVANAVSQFWTSAGVPEILFGNNKSSAALSYSVKLTEAVVYDMVLAFQTWMRVYDVYTYRLTYGFRVRILKVTTFSAKEQFDQYARAGSLGAPVTSELMAVLGYEPSALENKTFLEHEVLNITEKFTPYRSSHTLSRESGPGTQGAPVKDEESLKESGATSREYE